MTLSLAAADSGAPVQSACKAFLLGFTVNMLNPKAILFFLSIFATFVAATTPAQVKGLYAVAMVLLTVGWFVLVSLLLTTPAARRFYARASKWIDRVSGAVFIGFGIRLMVQKASS